MFFNNKCCNDRIIPHVHSAEGFVEFGGLRCDMHKHCFNGIAGKIIPCRDSHVHEVCIITDIEDCHCHKLIGKTGPAIPTGCGNHIHLMEGCTTRNDDHMHRVNVATGIEEPIRRE